MKNSYVALNNLSLHFQLLTLFGSLRSLHSVILQSLSGTQLFLSVVRRVNLVRREELISIGEVLAGLWANTHK